MEQEEKKTASVPSSIGDTTLNVLNGRSASEHLETPPTQVQSGGSIQGEPTIPRRLSQLFLPPSEEASSEDYTNESTRLLEDTEKKGTIVASQGSTPQSATVSPQAGKRGDKDKKKKKKSEEGPESFSVLDQIESGKASNDHGESDHESSDSSSESQSSGSDSNDNTPDRDPDYTSWDDTICSNRSAYFKHYYQKNLAALGAARTTDGGATSHNSLVSLIREKSKMSQEKSPEDKKKKRKEDLSLTVLVIFLFLVLVIGISLIYHFYNIHLEELSLFKRLKFYEERRLLNLIDSKGNMDIQARLGTNLPPYAKPEDCTHYLQYFYKQNSQPPDDYDVLPPISLRNKSTVDSINVRKGRQDEFEFDEETVCLDWANQARVQIHKAASHEQANCYNVFWSAHTPGKTLQDCILITKPEHGVWWGIGEITGGGYPLESITKLESVPFLTSELGKRPFGRILRRTFLSSFGGLLLLPDHLPARVSVNPDELCVSVDPRDSVNPTLRLTLNYTLCSLPNISSTINYLRYLARGSKHYLPLSTSREVAVRTRILERIEQPLWIPYRQPKELELSCESVLKYANKIILDEGNGTDSEEESWMMGCQELEDQVSSGGEKENQTIFKEKVNRKRLGHILLPLSWQEKTGNLAFDSGRFPNPKAMVKALEAKGFRMALTISPLVSTDTEAFKNGTTEGYWVQQMGSFLPALMKHQGIHAGALTDFTNSRAIKWFTSNLEKFKKIGIDRFHLDAPDAYSIPRYHKFDQFISNPDIALQWFLKAVATVSWPLSTESVISPPRLPTFVSVGSSESGWKSLASLVPRILTLTMLGYPLVDAGVVGGKPTRVGNVPDSKLYVRWFQAVSFLPAYQMNVLPSMYDESTQTIVRDFLHKRKIIVLPRLRQAVNGALVNNTPLIFPLGMLYPDDIEAAAVADEWILGDDLLVAPILKEDDTSRDIYIPTGLWESQLDGKLKRGPGWIYHYKVPLSNIAHFVKRHTM